MSQKHTKKLERKQFARGPSGAQASLVNSSGSVIDGLKRSTGRKHATSRRSLQKKANRLCSVRRPGTFEIALGRMSGLPPPPSLPTSSDRPHRHLTSAYRIPAERTALLQFYIPVFFPSFSSSGHRGNCAKGGQGVKVTLSG